jgi:SAM-dependent methyltransferase
VADLPVQPLPLDDAETTQWLQSCRDVSVAKAALARVLRLCFSLTDTNGILNRGQMFVLSREQVRSLLLPHLPLGGVGGGGDPCPRRLRMFDIGAGDGGVTAQLAPFFSEVFASEVSGPMAARLRQRGFTVFETPFVEPLGTPLQCDGGEEEAGGGTDKGAAETAILLQSRQTDTGAPGAGSDVGSSSVLWNLLSTVRRNLVGRLFPASVASSAATSSANEAAATGVPVAPGSFDLVSIFNVLDRCDYPADLLRNAIKMLRPRGGVLLLTVVLPFSEFVEDGTARRAVRGPLPMRGRRCQDGVSLEASLAALLQRVLLPLGLEVLRVARVPYLCRGDTRRPYYVLSDAVILCRVAPDIAASADRLQQYRDGVWKLGSPLLAAAGSPGASSSAPSSSGSAAPTYGLGGATGSVGSSFSAVQGGDSVRALSGVSLGPALVMRGADGRTKDRRD